MLMTASMRNAPAAALMLITLAAACGPDAAAHAARSPADSVRADSVARARQDSINRTLPGYVVDSILPVEAQLRRFRAATGGPEVTGLVGASPSRDALVSRFVRALAAADTAELLAMVVSAREFADLIYPESPNVHPPYQQDPALAWRMIQSPSGSGLTRLIRRAGGIPVTLAGYRCDPTPGVQGHNRFWTNCTLRLVGAQGDTSTHRFFGNIVERAARFKVMSYRNEF